MVVPFQIVVKFVLFSAFVMLSIPGTPVSRLKRFNSQADKEYFERFRPFLERQVKKEGVLKHPKILAVDVESQVVNDYIDDIAPEDGKDFGGYDDHEVSLEF
ncbi:hypothetical protein L596_030390 [Steinernema carpocapsae]|uniref:Uncharacterized protein n=1 Tax=Steinernema carpocapsae TaxID=34508 RepID=A0A4U5LP84_STECR|nr:hypothetical protein L596_030390 [Steinernema carpocapsae]